MGLDLYLIRHAESQFNLHQKDLVGGQSNHVALTSLGMGQARALGLRLQREGIVFSAMYSSTALRAIQTANIVSGLVSFPLEKIVTDEAFLELNQGAWEGKPRIECYTPAALEAIARDQANFRPPGGESQKDVAARYVQGINAFPAKHEGAVALFCHGIGIRSCLQGVMDFDQRFVYNDGVDATKNTSITQLRYQHDAWWLVSINDAVHLVGI